VLHDRRGLGDAGFVHVGGTARHHPLGDAVGMSEVPTRHLLGSNGHRLKIMSAAKPFARPELLGWPSVPRPWDRKGQNRGLILMLWGTLHLLCDCGAEDAL
jgi:hypothetical protein